MGAIGWGIHRTEALTRDRALFSLFRSEVGANTGARVIRKGKENRPAGLLGLIQEDVPLPLRARTNTVSEARGLLRADMSHPFRARKIST